jgi:hypothetical protein
VAAACGSGTGVGVSCAAANEHKSTRGRSVNSGVGTSLEVIDRFLGRENHFSLTAFYRPVKFRYPLFRFEIKCK